MSENHPENHPAPAEDPLRQVWLHVHVPKAGGSTLRQLMNRNFGKGFYNSNSLLETRQYSREDVSEIIRCHPWVKCFSDHKLSLDLPYQHEHAKVFALGYVRDPVDRFISRYFFHRHFEEVNCIAQRLSFREFAHAELVQQDVHPQTNSQIYFLNGGQSFEDLTVVRKALGTGQAFLFPIERFDESCICLERLFPNSFSDLSYVPANVSKKDAIITDEDRELALRHLKIDYPVFELAHQFLDQMLENVFHSDDDRESTLAEFKDRCRRRYHNFYPPVAKGEPVPPIGSEPPPKPKQPTVVPQETETPAASVEPAQPSETVDSTPEQQPFHEPPDPDAEPKQALEPRQSVPAQPKLTPQPTLEPKAPVPPQPALQPKPTLPTRKPE